MNVTHLQIIKSGQPWIDSVRRNHALLKKTPKKPYLEYSIRPRPSINVLFHSDFTIERINLYQMFGWWKSLEIKMLCFHWLSICKDMWVILFFIHVFLLRQDSPYSSYRAVDVQCYSSVISSCTFRMRGYCQYLLYLNCTGRWRSVPIPIAFPLIYPPMHISVDVIFIVLTLVVTPEIYIVFRLHSCLLFNAVCIFSFLEISTASCKYTCICQKMYKVIYADDN